MGFPKGAAATHDKLPFGPAIAAAEKKKDGGCWMPERRTVMASSSSALARAAAAMLGAPPVVRVATANASRAPLQPPHYSS